MRRHGHADLPAAARGRRPEHPAALDEGAGGLLESQQFVKHQAMHAARSNRADRRQRIADVSDRDGPRLSRLFSGHHGRGLDIRVVGALDGAAAGREESRDPRGEVGGGGHAVAQPGELEVDVCVHQARHQDRLPQIVDGAERQRLGGMAVPHRDDAALIHGHPAVPDRTLVDGHDPCGPEANHATGDGGCERCRFAAALRAG